MSFHRFFFRRPPLRLIENNSETAEDTMNGQSLIRRLLARVFSETTGGAFSEMEDFAACPRGTSGPTDGLDLMILFLKILSRENSLLLLKLVNANLRLSSFISSVDRKSVV